MSADFADTLKGVAMGGLGVLVPLVAFGCWLVVLNKVTEVRKRKAERKREAEREAERERGSSGGRERSMSERERQHAWYGEENSDLDWRDRERAEMYGIDVDTYRSNVIGD
jgi:hypothetical protein